MSLNTLVTCQSCQRKVLIEDTWEFKTFSADEGQISFRICTECRKRKGTTNIQDYAEGIITGNFPSPQ